MNKRTVYTAGGVALSLLIAVGGWFFTDSMIGRKENDLLSVRGNVHVDAPQQTVIVTPNSDTPDSGDPIIIENNFPKLNASEMYRVLETWSMDGSEQPHEPTEGQLNMEQALNMAKDWLAYYCQNGLFPSEALNYDTANAYLAKNVPNGVSMSAQNPLINFDDIRSEQQLKPFYSYWTVHLNGTAMNVTLIINAGTGQIWKAEINSNTTAVTFDGTGAEELQNAFIDYLSVEDWNGLLDISAEISSGTLEGKNVMSSAVMSVSAIMP